MAASSIQRASRGSVVCSLARRPKQWRQLLSEMDVFIDPFVGVAPLK
jgi:hypothetical protein